MFKNLYPFKEDIDNEYAAQALSEIISRESTPTTDVEVSLCLFANVRRSLPGEYSPQFELPSDCITRLLKMEDAPTILTYICYHVRHLATYNRIQVNSYHSLVMNLLSNPNNKVAM